MQHLATPEANSSLAFILRRVSGTIESQIRGTSMGTTLAAGTRIRIRCGPAPARSAGTVVAFLGFKGLTGHRVIGHVKGRHGRTLLLTRGDGMLVCDPPLDPERVLGEITEWQDGEAWHPLPGAPWPGTGGRVMQALSVAMIRTATWVHPGLAAVVSEALDAVVRRAR